MLVSLSMVNMKSVKVNLPTAATATPEIKKDFVDISVDKLGGVFLDKNPIALHELSAQLAAAENRQSQSPRVHQRRPGRPPRPRSSTCSTRFAPRASTKSPLKSATRREGNPMSRWIQILNIIGVLALAILCILQRRTNSRYARANDRLNETSYNQANKIADQDKTIKDDEANLDDLRRRLTESSLKLNDTQAKLAGVSAERDQVTAQRDQLKAEMDKWVAAVARATPSSSRPPNRPGNCWPTATRPSTSTTTWSVNTMNW